MADKERKNPMSREEYQEIYNAITNNPNIMRALNEAKNKKTMDKAVRLRKNEAKRKLYNDRSKRYISPGKTEWNNFAEYKIVQSRKAYKNKKMKKELEKELKESTKENHLNNTISPSIGSLSSDEIVRSFSGNNDLAFDPNIFSGEKTDTLSSISSNDTFLNEFDDHNFHPTKKRKTAKSRGGRKTKKSRK